MRDHLISWLNDAHAMEEGSIAILEAHADQMAQALPEAAIRIREHAEETREHAQRIEECLALMDSAPAADSHPPATDAAEHLALPVFADGIVNRALMHFAIEQFEVGAYTALVAAAEELGEMDVAALCEDNRREDQLMASWIERQIPEYVATMTSRSNARTR
jgi:ferritin-like metal-binding protein YciE